MNSEQTKQTSQIMRGADASSIEDAKRVSLALFFVLLPLNAIYIFLFSDLGQNLLFDLVFAVTILVNALAFVANRLVNQKRATDGMLLLTVAIAIAVPVYSASITGVGVILAISGIAVITLITGLTLGNRYAGWTISLGAISAALAVIVDIYSQHERIDIPILQVALPAITGTVVLIYGILIVRNFSNYALRSKLIIAFVAVATIALGTLAIITANTNRIRTLQTAGQNLTAETASRAIAVGETLGRELQSLQAFSLSKTLQDRTEAASASYAGKSPTTIEAEIKRLDEQWRAADLADNNNDPLIRRVLNEELSSEINEYRLAFPENVEVFVTDRYGANVGATNRTSDYYQADEEWWQAAYNNGRGAVYIGEPAYDQSIANYAMIIAIPVYAHNTQDVVGIFRSTVELNTLTSIFDIVNVGKTGQIQLYLADGQKLSSESAELVPGEPDALSISPSTPSYIQGEYDGIPSLISRAPITALDANKAPIINQLNWTLVAHQDIEESLLLVREQSQTTTLISMLLLGLAAASAFFASQVLARPIQNLTLITEKLAAGELDTRANITTRDEVGALANSFNQMAERLQESLSGLEARVAERTTDLEIARIQSEKRANQLVAVGEITKIINSEQRLDALLPLITRLVSDRFGFYHTGIFLVDETRQYAVLQAANSEGGRNMLKRGHKLEVGASGIVGYVTQTGIPRIALDVGLDAVYFDNPDLPNTRSEAALPLKIRDRVIGALDVQSEHPGAFTEEDTNILGIMADQIAIAIENARLLESAEQSLNELRTLYGEKIQEAWMSFSHDEALVGYQQSLSGGKSLLQPIITDEIQQTMNRGDVLVFHADGKTEEPSIVVPIKLRGQIIGVMRIKAPNKDRQWTSSEVDLTEAVSERLSLALENARLIQESQRQAIKEQTISDITGKIGSSINLQNVLQTAVEELGRSIPGSEVIIKFQSDNTNDGSQ
jgi:GAF domain-containing protein/HAMP domain-containing protein